MEKKKNMSKARRNEPCPCGSGKKYKNCCYQSDYLKVTAKKKDIKLTLGDGTKITHSTTSIDSIPTHNKNGLTPNITSEQMMDLFLDEIYKIIEKEKVGMMHDLVDEVVLNLDIVPTFTYRHISERMVEDGRFEIFQMQICSLKGTDPVKLLADKLKI